MGNNKIYPFGQLDKSTPALADNPNLDLVNNACSTPPKICPLQASLITSTTFGSILYFLPKFIAISEGTTLFIILYAFCSIDTIFEVIIIMSLSFIFIS